MRAVVMGGTGLVGLHLLQALSAARVPTVSLARRVDVGVTGIDWRILASTQITAADIPKKATVAFCALGTTMKQAGSEEAFRAVDHDLVVRFATACKEAGVPAFHLVSAAGASPRSRVFYSRVKGETEAALQALDFTTLALYRPGLLLGQRKERRPLERALIGVARGLRPVLPPAWRGVEASAVARAMVREARNARAGTRIVSNAEIQRLAR